ncbi:MAG: serine/threonine-protein kinase [Xenococcaceae cyanobacterium MO_188.B32]|nr:serine/threonine-protein kinase [Xenococcaceae cyanobacterium MO_188.B32]
MKAALLNKRYRILETLGRGGFGETYLAEDTHMPSGRKCVIKQLKPVVEQPHIPLWMKERFQREAAILEELGEGHPQIPRLYAYFSEEDKFYLVQEWIEGQTLAQKWSSTGNLDAEQVISILVELLPVLDYIHERRIVHRDIKPENIILRDRDLMPILIDFGVVKEAMATKVHPKQSSAFSVSIGTPGYMPSEQAAGRPVYSSDLYSLGLTAIFLLTGKSPQDLEADPRTGEIIWQKYAPNLDEKLTAILDKAIRFHPRDRFSSAREMLTALQSSSPVSQVISRTMRVAPGNISSPTDYISRSDKNYTVAYDAPSSRKSNWFVKSFLFFFITTGISLGAFVAGFSLLSNWWNSRPTPSPQAKVEESNPISITIPKLNKPEKPKKPEKSTEELEQEAKNREEEVKPAETKTNLEAESEIPEVVIDTKPAPKPTPQPESQPQIKVPIITTGTSESQLVSTLGKPTTQRKERRGRGHTLTYHNVGADRVHLSYRSDSNGKIRQTDIALSQSVSLGAMQDTLAEMLGGNAPAGVKEKLRRVYSRQAAFSFFRVGNLEGKVQRDAKDRVSISVWESGF